MYATLSPFLLYLLFLSRHISQDKTHGYKLEESLRNIAPSMPSHDAIDRLLVALRLKDELKWTAVVYLRWKQRYSIIRNCVI